MCFYLQQHLLNKEQKKPSPSYSASLGRAPAPAAQSSAVSPRVSLSLFGSVRAFTGVGERLQAQRAAGFAGLEVEMFLGIHVQSGPVAGAEDPALEVGGRAVPR